MVLPEVEAIEKKATAPTYIEVKHLVEKGQTLRDIATMFEVKVVDLVIWNDLESTEVVKGQTIIVHVKKPVVDEAVEAQ